MRRLGAISAVTLSLLTASAAAAAAPTPGEADGVRAVTSHGKVVFVFSRSAKKLWKRVAGREVSIDCQQTPQIAPGSPPIVSSGDTFKAPKTGMKLKSGVRAGKFDVCAILVSDRTLVVIALTQQGATFVDEAQFANDMLSVVDLADSLAAGGRWPSADQVVAKAGGSVVALAAPSDAPPAGKYGFYSDANQHIAVAVLSSAGRRLFFEISGDTVSSNVFRQISFAAFNS
jgi:hypothetical protein